MKAVRNVKHLSKLIAAGVLAIGLGAAFQSPANAATEIKVSPSTGLTDGTVVNVSGVGLKAGDVYHVGQCAAVSAISYACNSPESVDVTANASGEVSTRLTVRRTFQGFTADGSTHAIDCSAVPCVIGVYSDTFDGGAVPISFR